MDDAYLESVEIRRVKSTPGESAEVQLLTVDLREGEDSDRDDIALQSRDFLRINSVPNWSPTKTITLSGEVLFPGDYLISPGETLSSVLRRAGGITEGAFLEGAVFTRESLKRAEKRQLENLANSILRDRAARLLTLESVDNSVAGSFNSANLSEEDLSESLMGIETRGRLVIDLRRVIEGDSNADIELQAGDSLEVPGWIDAVTVVGEVNRPGSYRYDASLNYEDYLALSAGYTSRSNPRGVYIVQPNGRVWMPQKERKGGRWLRLTASEKQEIRSGDTVVVPIDQEFKPLLRRYREISTVLFQSIFSITGLLAL